MALLFCDGMGEVYASVTEAVRKWTDSNGSPTFVAGRYAGRASVFSNTQRYERSLGADYATLIVGFNFKVSAWTNAPTIVRFRDSAGTLHGSFKVGATGLLLYLNGGGATVATGTTTIALDTWYHFEARIAFNNTTGAIELRLDGVEEINVTGVDTCNTAIESARFVDPGIAASGATVTIDDFYVLDTTGTHAHDFLGNGARVTTCFPGADGDVNDFDRVGGGSNNYEAVDEQNDQDDRTTYVESNVVGEKELYHLSSIDPGTVYGVLAFVLWWKSQPGNLEASTLVKSGGVESYGSTVEMLSNLETGTAFALAVTDLRPTDPATSAQWTKAAIDALQVGVRVVA